MAKDKGDKPKKDKTESAAPEGFAAPRISSGDYFKPAEHEGELVLVKPISLKPGFYKATKAGEEDKDAIECEVVLLDAGNEVKEGMISNVALFRAIEPALEQGKRVIFRVEKGIAKPPNSAPWLAGAPTEADYAKAKAYLDSLDPLR